VYVLENNIEETLAVKLPFSEVSILITYDESNFANNGSLSGNANLDGGVLNLNGFLDYVDCGNDSSLELGVNDLSIVARIKLDPIQGTFSGIVTKGASNSSNTGYSFFYYATSGYLALTVCDGSTRLWLNSNYNLGLNDNQWHTVGVSLDRNGDAVFYVDGNTVGSENASQLSEANIINQENNLQIGGKSTSSQFSLIGQIDSIRAYKRALSAIEMENQTIH
jgi:hypothetical protein